MSEFERKQTELITEFDRYIQQYPEFAEQIPFNAVICLQLDEDEDYNAWSRRLAQQVADAGQPIIYIRIKKLLPWRSRIAELEVQAAIR